MIKLVFTAGREPFTIDVRGREIWYKDRKWPWVRFVPPDEVISKDPKFTPIFILTDEEKAEYETATTEEELAEKIILDAKKQGCRFLNQHKMEDERNEKM